MPPKDTDSSTENYLNLLNENEKGISAYVHSLVLDRADAEDILQACKLTMWKQFDKFELGTNFLAWGRKIALNQILNYRRSAKRKPVFSADPEFIEAIAQEIDRQNESLSARSEALRFCLKKLPESQRKTVLLRYYEDQDISEIAEVTDRTEGAVYRLLSRIRASLNTCITKRLSSSPA